ISNKQDGLRRGRAALWGMALLAGAWLILYTINPQLLKFNLNPCPAGSSGCTIAAAPANNATGSIQNGPACGASTNGCSNSSYCATINGNQYCAPTAQQTANQNCTTLNGTWDANFGFNTYCYLPQYSKTKADCTSASQATGQNFQWGGWNPFNQYCYLQ